MSKTWFLGLSCYLISLASIASENINLQGIYEVQEAYLNETHCDRDGRLVDYASRYFQVTKVEEELNIAICNGHSLSDLQCMGGYRSTALNSNNIGWTGFQYTAKKMGMAENKPRCRLHALRRSIFPMKGDFIRYERTDWSETLRDFIAECNENMSAEYQVSQSLKCNSHISIIGKKVRNFTE